MAKIIWEVDRDTRQEAVEKTNYYFDFWDVEKTGSAFLLIVRIHLPQKVLLGMTSYLRRCSCRHKVLRNSSPIPFPQLLQTSQKGSMFLLSPWLSCIISQNLYSVQSTNSP